MKKAVVVNASGLMLIIDKEGQSPALFLEWLKSQGPNRLINVIDDAEEGNLGIRLMMLEEGYNDAAAFINGKLEEQWQESEQLVKKMLGETTPVEVPIDEDLFNKHVEEITEKNQVNQTPAGCGNGQQSSSEALGANSGNSEEDIALRLLLTAPPRTSEKREGTEQT